MLRHICRSSSSILAAPFAARAPSILSPPCWTLLHTSSRAHSSSSSSPSLPSPPAKNTADVQDLVFKIVSEMLRVQDSPDDVRATITLGSRLKADLGLDVFKTYQLLDKLEQEIAEIDISVEDADKAQTLEDIVALVSKSRQERRT